ncbi:MAG: helix-turn-helix transcriptional regulator [Myxococcota bacterium]
MREVPAPLFGFIRESFERHGIETEPHLRDLKLAHVDTSRLGERVDWDELALFMNRCGEGLTDEEQERLGERYAHANRFLSLLMRVTLSPRLYHHVLWRLVTPHAYPHIDVGCRDVPDGRVLISLVLPEQHRPCPIFFRGTTGELRRCTELLGHPPSEVEADVGPYHGHYLVTLPERESIVEALKDAGGRVAEQVGPELGRLMVLIARSDTGGAVSVQDLQRAHGLTRAEARVAVRIGEGKAVPDIAEELGISVQTVRTHLKRAYAKTGARRQAELARLVLAGRG